MRRGVRKRKKSKAGILTFTAAAQRRICTGLSLGLLSFISGLSYLIGSAAVGWRI